MEHAGSTSAVSRPFEIKIKLLALANKKKLVNRSLALASQLLQNLLSSSHRFLEDNDSTKPLRNNKHDTDDDDYHCTREPSDAVRQDIERDSEANYHHGEPEGHKSQQQAQRKNFLRE